MGDALSYFQSAYFIDELQHRRLSITGAIGNAVAIVQGNPVAGAMILFCPHKDFFFLCGLENLAPNGPLHPSDRTIDGRGRPVAM